MISQTLTLMGAMYGAIGPGFILVMSLPLLLIALFIVVRALRSQSTRS